MTLRAGAPVGDGAVPEDIQVALRDVVSMDSTEAMIQIAGHLDGHPFRWVSGTTVWDEPASHSTLHNVYCAAKPFLAATILVELEKGGRSTSTTIGEICPDIGWVPPDLTVGEILRHQAGLESPDALHWRLTDPPDRPSLMDRSNWTGRSGAYSSIAGGLVLERVLTSLTGRSSPEIAQEVVRELWSLPRTFVAISAREAEELSPRPSAALTLTEHGIVPLLSEAVASFVSQIQPALGCLTCAEDLADFYNLAGQVLDGHTVSGMPSPDTLRSHWIDGAVERRDATLKRRSRFSHGVMRDIHVRFGSGRLSPETYGHTGGFCTAVGFQDPVARLDLAIVLGVALPGQDLYDHAVGVAVDATLDVLGR